MSVTREGHQGTSLPSISRRDFLKLAGAAGILAGTGQLGRLPGAAEAGGTSLPTPASDLRVASAWIPKGGYVNAGDTFQQVVEAATDFSWLSRGDRVFIKLALNSGSPYPSTTDPWALHLMIRMLQEKGAGKVVVGDQSGPIVNWTPPQQRGSSRECARTAGLLQVIEENGAEPVFFEERGWDAVIETTPVGEHHWPEPLLVTSLVEEVDHIVYMPRVSSHMLGEITSGLKLPVGFLRNDSRRVFHGAGESFYAMYEEINHVPEIESRRRLIVSSGRLVLSMRGPDGGPVTEPDYGLVFASEYLLAHEMLAYAWLQWNREFATPPDELATAGAGMRSAYRPGDIYQHPAVVNIMRRKGISQPGIGWEQLNQGPDDSVIEYLKKQMKA
ncbi:MAG: DUF362 domain-containing protein [Actinobacteria bacterium]|nr:DUF362 domain-containing protein [Actinomycetota bacterium]MCL5026463.1 DUF362 domain-containing protein [Chloroflexota bacterium]